MLRDQASAFQCDFETVCTRCICSCGDENTGCTIFKFEICGNIILNFNIMPFSIMAESTNAGWKTADPLQEVEIVRALVQKLSPAIIPVGVFRDEVIDTVEELLQDGTIRIAQLHGHEDESYIRELKSRGDYTVIRAFNETSFDQAGRSSADYVLLDHAAGGTGETFDWSLARKVKRPFFLAGGIGPENLEEALTCVQPWAVDLSSKVETDGRKDREKILAAVQAVRRWNGQ